MERAGGTVRGYVVSQVPSELMEEPSWGADMNAAADDSAASPAIRAGASMYLLLAHIEIANLGMAA